MFGRAGMNIFSVYDDMRRSGIKILVFQSTDGAAIYRVGIVSAKAGNIKIICSATDLLIRRKTNLYGTMRAVV